jgi:signal transduction histidine kinase
MFFFSLEGELLDSFYNTTFDIDFEKLLSPYVSKVISSDTYLTTRMSNDFEGLFYFVAGCVAYSNEIPVGVFFVLKENQEILSWFISFCVVITTIMLMALTCVVMIYRNNMQTSRVKDAYIANVSHSLKSPIASIRALTETMYDGLITDPKKLKEYYGIILSESANLEQTVMDMLELSRMQSNLTNFTKSTVPACQVFDSAIKKYTTLCNDLGIIFHVPTNVESLPELYTNSSRIATLLDVLLDNATKFVREDGEIWLDVTKNNVCLTVCIRDNGIGIDRASQPHVFERFYKGDLEHNKRGSGLGLAIAREIAISLDEKLWFKSVPGDGTSFFFTIHLALQDEKQK